jgi:succinyl-diaminopimelate desuccinylase
MRSDPEELRDRLVRLTRDLVLIESTDDKPDERARCFQFIRNHLESCPGISISMYRQEGYDSLVALPEGVRRASVLFCAHLDVVDHPDDQGYVSSVENGLIVGPGAGDMKGQLAILMLVFTRLLREHPELPIGLLVTSDEERGGEAGVRFMVEDIGLDCDVAVIPDGGSINDITIEEKGILHLCLRCGGTAAHAARPWQGDNPLERLVEGLARLRAAFAALQPGPVDPLDLATHWFPTCSLTRIATPNESVNRIPEVASALLDIRFPPPHSSAEMLQRVEQALGPVVEVEPIIQVEPTYLEPDPVFLKVTREVTGREVRLVRASAGSDARFFCARGIPVLLSRPRVGNLHGRNEWIEIESMLEYHEICRRYVLRKLGIPE